MPQPLQAPRGTKDILPEEYRYYQYIRKVIEKRVANFGFEPIDLPIFEKLTIFERSLGNTTDLVTKEMFEVKRLSKQKLSAEEAKDENQPYVLRPEATAGIIRAYLQNGLFNWPPPVKLWFFGPMFRYDRPQKGRFRQFTQANIEVIGSDDPSTDALIIFLAWQIFGDLKLQTDTIIEINTLGGKDCRAKVTQSIKDYFKKYRSSLCQDCQKRLERNPLRILDCKQPKCQTIQESGPQLPDLVCETDRRFFSQVLEALDELKVPYDLNPRLVRGFDYYTQTAFEFRDRADPGRQASFLGGGRYDGLVQLLGGKPTPAIGWAAGVERLIEKLVERQKIQVKPTPPQLAVIQLGQLAKQKAVPLTGQLLQAGYSVIFSPGRESLKSQLRAANRSGAKLALIIGQREAIDRTVILRSMEDSSQETVALDKLAKMIKKKLKK